MAATTSLTDKQLEAARLAAMGKTQFEISQRMRISVSMVRQHLVAVKAKLGVTRQSEIAKALHEEGLL
jgi:DNA-binding CsgD family transcriptional regulator